MGKLPRKRVNQKMKKIKVTIMTNLSKPNYVVKDRVMYINEKYKNYLCGYEDLKSIYQKKISEYPIELIIEELQKNGKHNQTN